MADVPTRILKVAGTFGSYGEDGATFTPSVSEDGTLSWTNNKGLTNPNPVNVKGPTGDTGSTGPQGPQGDKGDPGVHVGSEAPTDGSNVWICPDDIPDAALPNPYKLTLTGAVEAEYDGSSAVTVSIPEGGPDGDYIPTPTTAEIGQTIVVKAVDENGKPTEWEASDMASGGGWKLFAEAELTEEVRVIDFGSNSGGESFPENQELYVYMKTVGCEGNTAKQNVMLVVASGSWRLSEAIWNDTTTKICTGVWLMKPADTPSIVGIGVKNASVVTYSPYIETFDGYITGLRIYVETTDVPFGVGTIIKIYGR